MSLIKNDNTIRELIISRTEKELNIPKSQIIEDALSYGVSINFAALSRYFKNEAKDSMRSSLTEFQVLWLCCRYRIEVKVKIKKQPYSKESAVKNLKTCKS
jgi:hypothetical protein